ncbi:ABC transporter C family member 3, partial [Mucuna pruriens]
MAWRITFSLIHLLGNVVVMSQAAWQVFIVLIPIMVACIWYQINNSIIILFCISTRIGKIVGICQAPVIHFSETIFGSTTIRCFEQESRFNDKHMRLIGRYSQPRLYSASAMEWLNYRLDILSTITVSFCLVLFISFPNSITAPVIITPYVMTLGIKLHPFPTSIFNVENEIISVKRILQYTSIPSEAPLVIKDNQVTNHIILGHHLEMFISRI